MEGLDTLLFKGVKFDGSHASKKSRQGLLLMYLSTIKGQEKVDYNNPGITQGPRYDLRRRIWVPMSDYISLSFKGSEEYLKARVRQHRVRGR